MDEFVLNGSSGGHECLRSHLSTKGPETILIGVVTPKDVDLNGFKVEQGDQVFERSTHPLSLANLGPGCARSLVDSATSSGPEVVTL